jgi:hypothetical protein
MAPHLEDGDGVYRPEDPSWSHPMAIFSNAPYILAMCSTGDCEKARLRLYHAIFAGQSTFFKEGPSGETSIMHAPR